MAACAASWARRVMQSKRFCKEGGPPGPQPTPSSASVCQHPRDMGPMATLHAAALHRRDYLPCFSDLERQEILGTRNGKRRRERVAGRLAAKFLFLQHHSATGVEWGKLMHLTAAHL